ncbi:MAG TPA: hypothetical protein VK359_07340 [Rubrobacteraceae bacterium]|nr:hypothetical protein [Rubrobacteraceae bacterium]
MHCAQDGEPFTVMFPEVTEDRLVGVEAEELSDDLDGENLRVESLGAGPRWRTRRPLSRSSMRQKTEMMKVLRSKRENLLYAGRFGRYRA